MSTALSLSEVGTWCCVSICTFVPMKASKMITWIYWLVEVASGVVRLRADDAVCREEWSSISAV
jgi:hypothetical protein